MVVIDLRISFLLVVVDYGEQEKQSSEAPGADAIPAEDFYTGEGWGAATPGGVL